MTRAEFEELHNVRLIPKSKSWTMRLIGFIVPESLTYCMVYRWPWQLRSTMAHPDDLDPMKNLLKLDHELVHAVRFARWWGPFFMALAILPPGRWYVERWAYLHDIEAGRYMLWEVVEILWFKYRINSWGWPAMPMMAHWFEQQLRSR